MTTAAGVNAAPREIKLAGQTYRITPLRRIELAEFVAWVQDREFDAAKRMAAGMEPEQRPALLSHAWDKISTYTIASPHVIQQLGTPDGAAKALWLGLRHEHPDLTEEALFEMMNDEQTLADALDAIDKATGGDSAGKKKTTKRRKKQSR